MVRWRLLRWLRSCGFSDQPAAAITWRANGPDKARQFAGDRGGDDIGRLAGAGEPAIARAQPGLRLPGDLADRLRLGWFSWRSCSSRLTLAGKRLSSVQRFSLIVGFENSLVGNPANRSAGARPG